MLSRPSSRASTAQDFDLVTPTAFQICQLAAEQQAVAAQGVGWLARERNSSDLVGSRNPPYESLSTAKSVSMSAAGGFIADFKLTGISGTISPRQKQVTWVLECVRSKILRSSLILLSLRRLGIEKLFHKGKVVCELVAVHQVVGGEKPNPGAAAQLSGMRPGKKLLAFAMRAGRLDRQHRRDFARVEVIAGKPQSHKRPAPGFCLSLHRGGCQAVHPGHR